MAVVLVAIMMMAIGVTAFAQTEGTASAGTGSITIENAAKGETYAVYKLFDATLTSDSSGIAYTGDIPTSLTDYFEKDEAGNIHVKDGKTDQQVTDAVTNWAKTQADPTVVSDGTPLTFAGLAYGYYAVRSSQGATVTINSTKPDAQVYDKNSKEITVTKTAGKTSYSIGDTITYTATFDTVNFVGSGDSAEQVTKYTITDTLPEFLSDVAISSVTITKKDGTTTDETLTKSFDSDGKFEIEWATKSGDDYTSKYDNGAKIIVVYTAKLTSTTNVDAADTNRIKIQPTTVKPDGTTNEPWDDSWQDTAEIKTFAAALKKTDGSSNPLSGAQFAVNGLTVTGSDGIYTVQTYDSTSSTLGTTMSTDSNGKLYIIGLASDASLTVTETKAPDGYNKLDGTFTLTPQQTNSKIIKTSGTISYDADGNVTNTTSKTETTENETANLSTLDTAAYEVVNNKGSVLPSTGGIGTTIFYVVGAVLVLAAGILLVTKRRMSVEK